jgi:hypothetical protein
MLADATPPVEGQPALRLHKNGVRIGGVSLALTGISWDEVRMSRELEVFRDHDESPNIEVQVEWIEKLQRWPGNPVFGSGALWTLFRDDPEFIFDFTSPVFGGCPYKRLRTDGDFRSAQLILNREAMKNHHPIFPLEYPADELLITNYLASGLGVEVHGCGLVDAETGGHLFLGHSGAGKSTTTRLWKSLRNPEILSDDRIILRLHHGELWMYGTPWHGEAAFAMPGKARISRVFILDHRGENEITPLTGSRAVGELFARSFPPFHNAEALERTVGFLNQVLDTVPCYQFGFVPNPSAVRTILGFHD